MRPLEGRGILGGVIERSSGLSMARVFDAPPEDLEEYME
jgi:hypothetical protein